ncbi:hypothetical protein PQQ51_28295 [Paraburkholderia xenovorans]
MSAGKSLRLLIEEWLSPTLAMPIRVMRFSHTRSNLRRYVCVEAQRPEAVVVLFFFRHDDGLWYVLPPETAV